MGSHGIPWPYPSHNAIIVGGVRSGYKRAVNQIVEAEMPQAMVKSLGLDQNPPVFLGKFEP